MHINHVTVPTTILGGVDRKLKYLRPVPIGEQVFWTAMLLRRTWTSFQKDQVQAPAAQSDVHGLN